MRRLKKAGCEWAGWAWDPLEAKCRPPGRTAEAAGRIAMAAAGIFLLTVRLWDVGNYWHHIFHLSTFLSFVTAFALLGGFRSSLLSAILLTAAPPLTVWVAADIVAVLANPGAAAVELTYHLPTVLTGWLLWPRRAEVTSAPSVLLGSIVVVLWAAIVDPRYPCEGYLMFWLTLLLTFYCLVSAALIYDLAKSGGYLPRYPAPPPEGAPPRCSPASARALPPAGNPWGLYRSEPRIPCWTHRPP
jgi:hypothetical protein